MIRRECLNQSVDYMRLDLSDFASIDEFANKIATKVEKLDFVICNAGVGWKFDHPTITVDGHVIIQTWFSNNLNFENDYNL